MGMEAGDRPDGGGLAAFFSQQTLIALVDVLGMLARALFFAAENLSPGVREYRGIETPCERQGCDPHDIRSGNR
jgi:hypothetical protein